MTRQSIAVMASGRGTNLAAILEAANNGKCPVDVRVVLSNKVDAPALQIARDAGVDTILFINPKDYPDRVAYDQACSKVIESHQCDWVVLAGYMRILSSGFVSHFENRLINIHPALLPSFTGADGVADALAYGVKFSGCTVHLVHEEVDAGPILAQASVPVLNDDSVESLHQRIQKEEYTLYPNTLRRLVEEEFHLEGRRVIWHT
ncbi:MAG: phosphoribosylglycinamide formyltransferase [Zetaproteobacteria bacterium]|nr:phosphoribosylglycinamide formyltransferase [Zetaproteobacteria bacterium]